MAADIEVHAAVTKAGSIVNSHAVETGIGWGSVEHLAEGLETIECAGGRFGIDDDRFFLDSQLIGFGTGGVADGDGERGFSFGSGGDAHFFEQTHDGGVGCSAQGVGKRIFVQVCTTFCGIGSTLKSAAETAGVKAAAEAKSIAAERNVFRM